ncbi:CoA transferase [Brevibacillus sp. H7]|uniref:CoA transferase n=1 Tax=Brevibacillus sp. H7 TaxID=3349138 RepID=UPI00380C58F5
MRFQGSTPKATGNRHPSISPFAVLPVSDGHIVVAAGNDQLEKEMSEVLSKRTGREWLQVFEDAGIPCSEINDIEKVVQHPQVAAREMVIYQEHPNAGRVLMPGIPIKLSKTPGSIETPAPSLGEHSHLILSELGYTEDEIVQFKVNRII